MNHLVRETISRSLEEDIGHGDITSILTIPEGKRWKARLLAKEDLVVAGLPFVQEVFRQVDPDVAVTLFVSEGSSVAKGIVMAEISGEARSLLAGERVGLNILQRISGIATLTRAYVGRVEGLKARIADTRKTTPGLRSMEKYGVRMGGGVNHRFGLYDGVLIKDNHIRVAGGVKAAVAMACQAHHLLKIEVEVKTFDELRDALEAGADVIMLDNMSIEQMKEAVGIVGGRALVEASGNVNIANVRAIAETGVDLISIGGLTHSARAMDISMKIIDEE
ncbi:MAG: carboxylating nicotinate-nucleotide diphosphorylase [Nitrospirales bacterium]|nr:carboxylating nicotinate-nucleotide diphosphorylase [Nitrospirales bacterium]